MKLFVIINYINKNIFLNYYNFIKIFNIDNEFFLSFQYLFKFNINYLINYKNKKSQKN